MSLYLKYRPQTWAEFIGQDLAVRKLTAKLKKKKLPHVVLLYGPTGSGKTSAARLICKDLGVKPSEGSPDFCEMNCADCRGIDDVRDIACTMRLAPMTGNARIWVLDEVVQWPVATQQAALKMLEDTPDHVYFILCTTDKTKLLDTIVGRCLPVGFKALTIQSIALILKAVIEGEGNEISSKVSIKIAEEAQGSARMAIQLLESVLPFIGEEAQIEALEGSLQSTLGIDLARGILYRKQWSLIADILQRLGQDVEGSRRVVLKYCETILLGNAPVNMKILATHTIKQFKESFVESGRAGLAAACWNVANGGKKGL